MRTRQASANDIGTLANRSSKVETASYSSAKRKETATAPDWKRRTTFFLPWATVRKMWQASVTTASHVNNVAIGEVRFERFLNHRGLAGPISARGGLQLAGQPVVEFH